MGPVNAEPSRMQLRHPEVVTRVARYFSCWGLTDGPALARVTYGVLRRAATAGITDPVQQMHFAMDEAERWAHRLAAHAVQPDPEARRLNIVGRLREALAEYPDCFLEDELPAEFLEIVLKPVPRVTPPATPSPMKPRDLGKQPWPLRRGFWARLSRRIALKIRARFQRSTADRP